MLDPLWIPVDGTSMLPALASGAEVRVAPGSLRRGAVYAFFDRRGVLIVHRYVGRRGGRRIFHGDGEARRMVEIVDDGWIIGRAVTARDETATWQVSTNRWEAWQQWMWLCRRRLTRRIPGFDVPGR